MNQSDLPPQTIRAEIMEAFQLKSRNLYAFLEGDDVTQSGDEIWSHQKMEWRPARVDVHISRFTNPVRRRVYE